MRMLSTRARNWCVPWAYESDACTEHMGQEMMHALSVCKKFKKVPSKHAVAGQKRCPHELNLIKLLKWPYSNLYRPPPQTSRSSLLIPLCVDGCSVEIRQLPFWSWQLFVISNDDIWTRHYIVQSCISFLLRQKRVANKARRGYTLWRGNT